MSNVGTRRHQEMKAFLALLALAIWFVGCAAADTLTSNAANYVVGDAIALTLTTANIYKTITITINTVQFAFVEDDVNGFTGTLTFNGYLTCQMIALASPTGTLTIVATGVDFANVPTTTTILPTYTPPTIECNVFFVAPPADPAKVPAATNFPVEISTITSFTDAYITLNGQFFCNIGPVTVVGVSATASCTGFVPCYLPSCAQFALVAQTTGNAPVTYPGPTVQLIPNALCVPVFAVQPEQTATCTTQFTALSTVDFTFKINQNDNINEYTNFEIWASIEAVGFPSSIFIAKVAGPLCDLESSPFTYLIADWVIPCELNTAGLITFTLSYTQTLDGNEKFLQVATPISFSIVSNPACYMSLVLNYPGPCPLPYNQSDCGCLAEGSGSSLAPCGNCPACPSLAVQSSAQIVPGSVLNFYVHNGSIASLPTDQIGVVANTTYYSNLDPFLYAVSPNFFYFSDLSLINGAIGFKPIGVVGNTTTPIPVTPPTVLISITAFPVAGIDYIWGIAPSSFTFYCGTQASISPTSATGLPIADFIRNIQTGPTGLWAIDTLNNLYYSATNTCLPTIPFAPTPFTSVIAIASSLTGVYYQIGTNLFHTSSPLFVPVAVPSGGPSTVSFISASNIDDSLTVVDTLNNVWILSGPTGTWTHTSFTTTFAIDYNASNLYIGYVPLPAGTFNVNHVQLGLLPIYNVIPTYSNLSLVITSSQPPLTIYSSSTAPSFDSCDNALLVSWTVPSSFQSVGPATATLSYTATFPNASVQSLTSTASFSIGPSPINPLLPRSFCPLPCNQTSLIPSTKKVGCSSCQ